MSLLALAEFARGDRSATVTTVHRPDAARRPFACAVAWRGGKVETYTQFEHETLAEAVAEHNLMVREVLVQLGIKERWWRA